MEVKIGQIWVQNCNMAEVSVPYKLKIIDHSKYEVVQTLVYKNGSAGWDVGRQDTIHSWAWLEGYELDESTRVAMILERYEKSEPNEIP